MKNRVVASCEMEDEECTQLRLEVLVVNTSKRSLINTPARIEILDTVPHHLFQALNTVCQLQHPFYFHFNTRKYNKKST